VSMMDIDRFRAGGTMAELRVCLVADDVEKARGISTLLAARGLHCSTVPDEVGALAMLAVNNMDLAIVAANGSSASPEMLRLARRVRGQAGLPLIALVSRIGLGVIAGSADVDDFVVEPWDADEVAARARRIVKSRAPGAADNGELIRCGELEIDLSRCEVHVGGRLVELTFKEYELLKFLVSHRGRVFTREALLNGVWGYDYYGGDRTVDVHIRRLRSKLGESDFIDTVRNIGYRARDDV
jgi:DNA-binding response OmpR family regulator